MSIPITIKWGKTLYDAKISILPGSPALDLKLQVQTLTNVPSSRQKLLCPKGWKGFLKDNDRIPDSIQVPKGKNSIVVTLIGSAETLVEKPPEERPRFVEDMSVEEIMKAEKNIRDENGENAVDKVDIVALQRERGSDREDGKMEMYQYNRLVTGLPQHQIGEKLAERIEANANDQLDSQRIPLLGETAMTMGQELRKAYINSLAVLKDGTLVSGLDDGHVQMWHRGELVKDSIHRAGGVDHVVTFPYSDNDGPEFVTGGSGEIGIWTDDGNQLLGIRSPPGTTPASLTTGNIRDSGGLVYLASCFRVTRVGNPHQFRLPPQDEAGRRRREAAISQERMIQENLSRTSRCVKIWFYDSSKSNSAAFPEDVILPNSSEDTAPITKVADLNGNLVCADEWGGIRVFEWDIPVGGTNRSIIHRQSKLLQIRCAGFHCRISCMEPIKEHLLAISIQAVQKEEGTGIISSASPLHITNPSGVYIVDLEKATVVASLDGHSDNVQCICPLPDGGILTAGGRMDATVRLWKSDTIVAALQADDEEIHILTESTQLKDPGYVFDLKVLPDSQPDSDVYAVAGARYNVIKIVI